MSQIFVAQAKLELEKAGEDLSGPCGAWKITNRAALLLGGPYGLFHKPQGNNCNGYSVDLLIRKTDGMTIDVLIDSGNTNGPTWDEKGISDVSNWRPPVGAAPVPVPDPQPVPSPCQCDLAKVEGLLEEIKALAVAILHNPCPVPPPAPPVVFPEYEGKVLGFTTVLRPRGK